jgi:3-oxoacyl-[acyl-carrier protein] reductase
MALTKLQAQELGAKGITVNGVLPGHTLTDRARHLAEMSAETNGTNVEQELASRAQSIPVGRLAEPEEIAHVVAFLCSRSASYLTGASILVDGGATMVVG